MCFGEILFDNCLHFLENDLSDNFGPAQHHTITPPSHHHTITQWLWGRRAPAPRFAAEWLSGRTGRTGSCQIKTSCQLVTAELKRWVFINWRGMLENCINPSHPPRLPEQINTGIKSFFWPSLEQNILINTSLYCNYLQKNMLQRCFSTDTFFFHNSSQSSLCMLEKC